MAPACTTSSQSCAAASTASTSRRSRPSVRSKGRTAARLPAGRARQPDRLRPRIRSAAHDASRDVFISLNGEPEPLPCAGSRRSVFISRSNPHWQYLPSAIYRITRFFDWAKRIPWDGPQSIGNGDYGGSVLDMAALPHRGRSRRSGDVPASAILPTWRPRAARPKPTSSA